MNKIETSIFGCFELQPTVFKDDRGHLIKTFHEDVYRSLNLETNFTEEYYSCSKQHVLRGLHFQLPPDDHIKCVTCISGKIFDVVVDLRIESPTFRKHFCIELDAEKGNMLYIPKGLAHGFCVLSKNAIFLNRTSTVYSPGKDTGIHWNSCGINWPIQNPIVSEKDKDSISMDAFLSKDTKFTK